MLVQKPSVKRSLEESTELYHQALMSDEEALSYLIEERHLSKEALAFFRIGVVRNPEIGHEQFQDRISFPYITGSGVTTLRFRFLGDNKSAGKAKFLSLSGDVPRLYNISSIMASDKIFLCEGETDTITAWMAGLPAVGISGAAAWVSVFRRVFRHHDVSVLADNDDSGAGLEMAREISKSLDGCDMILMPRGHDVSSYAAEFGLDMLRLKAGYDGEA